MTCHPEAIGDYIDGTLGADERVRLEAHLATCADCRALEHDLRQIRSAARTLDRLQPPDRVWTSLAARLPEAPAAAPGRSTGWRPWLAAAAVLLVALGVSWILVPGLRAPQPPPGAPSPAPAEASRPAGNAAAPETVEEIESVLASLQSAEQYYDKAIAGLERIAASDQAGMDPQVAAALNKNLKVIDQAIAESRAALKTEPESKLARDSLFELLRRKVSLLQDTIALMNEMRKGNQAGAARIVEGANKS